MADREEDLASAMGSGLTGGAVEVLAQQVNDANDEIERLRKQIADQEADNIKAATSYREENREGLATMSSASTKARYAIVLEEARDSTDPQYVDVAVNGRAYRMNRGVICEVPPEVIEVLKNAITGIASANIDDGGQLRGVKYRSNRRFPYRVLGKAIDENGQRVKKFDIDLPEYE